MMTANSNKLFFLGYSMRALLQHSTDWQVLFFLEEVYHQFCQGAYHQPRASKPLHLWQVLFHLIVYYLSSILNYFEGRYRFNCFKLIYSKHYSSWHNDLRLLVPLLSSYQATSPYFCWLMGASQNLNLFQPQSWFPRSWVSQKKLPIFQFDRLYISYSYYWLTFLIIF